MHQAKIIALCCALAVAAMGSVSRADSPRVPHYRLTQIGTSVDASLGGPSAADLNDRGEVVGSYLEPERNQIRAFLWRAGEIIDLGDLGEGQARFTAASAINSRSEVVGSSEDRDGRSLAFYWRDGHMVEVAGLPEDRYLTAANISDRGEILGASTNLNDFSSEAFVIDRRGVRVLPHLPGATSSTPTTIDRHGNILGSSALPEGLHSVLWRNGQVIDLSGLAPHNSFYARDINDRGQIVGTARRDEEDRGRAVVWQASKLTWLPLLYPQEVTSNTVGDINEADQVVGSTISFSTQQTRATLWSEGRVYDLNERIRDDDPLKPYVTLQNARKINESGQIIATGTDTREWNPVTISYLLTPDR